MNFFCSDRQEPAEQGFGDQAGEKAEGDEQPGEAERAGWFGGCLVEAVEERGKTECFHGERNGWRPAGACGRPPQGWDGTVYHAFGRGGGRTPASRCQSILRVRYITMARTAKSAAVPASSE